MTLTLGGGALSEARAGNRKDDRRPAEKRPHAGPVRNGHTKGKGVSALTAVVSVGEKSQKRPTGKNEDCRGPRRAGKALSTFGGLLKEEVLREGWPLEAQEKWGN